MIAKNESETLPAHTNRLAKEKSPYLLQHAHNPVDWYAWGEEAFARAKEEDKPVFLSIGYSTCHWCHVMEDESFSNEATAESMNRDFISIKVDREERPDIDSVYMSYVMATTGGGGWPMTVFLTPDKKPFYGGTYFPPEDRFGLPGFRNLLGGIADAWKNRREEILKSADSAAQFLKRQGSEPSGGTLGEEVFQASFEDFTRRFDPENGGFGGAPKFPMGHSLSYLLRTWGRLKNEAALEMAAKTLQAMARGGVYDQVGGGFHRYSTDSRWFLPHFEKMLYDNALLSRAYLEAYQATHEEFYGRISREILDYVMREMTGPEGGFFSAQDADSPDPSNPSVKKEGAYYVWEKGEIEKLFDKTTAEILSFHYGLEEKGNVAQDPHGEFRAKNVLFTAHSPEETASRFHRTPLETLGILSGARKKLLNARAGRPQPHVDDKVLTDWNGLMIASFAFASRVLNEPRYREAALKAALFLESRLMTPKGGLLHRYRDGEAGLTGNLDDYAFTVYGFLNLYEATFDPKWLERSRELCDEMIRLFWDSENKGFFLTSSTAELLITRPKEGHDGAIPSGNSLAALDLAVLYRITGSKEYRRMAEETLSVFSREASSQPSGFTQMLSAYDLLSGPSTEIVIAGDPQDQTVRLFLAEIYSRYMPNKVVLMRPEGQDAARITSVAPFLKDHGLVKEKPAVYVCRNFTCQLPVTEVSELKKILGRRP